MTDKHTSEDLSTPGPDRQSGTEGMSGTEGTPSNVDKSTSPQSDTSQNVGRGLTTANPAGFTDDALSQVKTFEDAFTLTGDVESFEDYGSGFDVIDNKHQLIGATFMIVEWRFNRGDMGEFVSAAVVTEGGRKLIVNDGSTGIRDQLVTVTRKRTERGMPPEVQQRGLLCRKGLRVSQYTYTDPKTGDQRPAETFYLA